MSQSAKQIVDSQLEAKIRAKDFWKIPEAAEFMRCHKDTVRSRIKAGDLAHTKPARTYLVPAGAIIDYLNNHAG